ncbi:hypothetical protein BCR32DRAFT_263673 [Anaeromyces robustus]|uniref:Uncharacterized protein n=1 Tax=Anaeromyces robustus TaxID=1754192 RepID=A0A1Y1XRF1_9FUNG|nr:hypothetical protein BCR32DRAFT_263673 [Anaeromyces robustus]|eukprot:ORX88235.1 hypothetical protein BCR32DRAFT_263673 [Anaeromyces robustus]
MCCLILDNDPSPSLSRGCANCLSAHTTQIKKFKELYLYKINYKNLNFSDHLYGVHGRFIKFSPDFNTVTYIEDKSSDNLESEVIAIENFKFDYDFLMIYSDIELTYEKGAYYNRTLYNGKGKLYLYNLELNNEDNCKLEDENIFIDNYELITDNKDKTLIGSTWGELYIDGIKFHLNNDCSFSVNVNKLVIVPSHEDPVNWLYKVPVVTWPSEPYYIIDGFFSRENYYEPIYKQIDNCKFNIYYNSIVCDIHDKDEKLIMNDITLDNYNNCELPTTYNDGSYILIQEYFSSKARIPFTTINDNMDENNRLSLRVNNDCYLNAKIGRINLPIYNDVKFNSIQNIITKFYVEEEGINYPIENCQYNFEDSKIICGDDETLSLRINNINLYNVNRCNSNEITNIHFYHYDNETEILTLKSNKYNGDEIIFDLNDECQLPALYSKIEFNH